MENENPRVTEYSADVVVEPARNPSPYCPWTNGNTYKHAQADKCLHRELIDFAAWIGPTPHERHLRLITINRFRHEVSLLWPTAKIICHGSTATNTNLPDGDLDFVVYDAPGIDPFTVLTMLNEHLRRHRVFSRSEVIEARCPIVKGIEQPFGFSVDIAVNNENGILNIERHLNYFRTYPSIVLCLMLLKVFLVQYRLDAPFTGGVSSNTLIQMILFIVQSLPEEKQIDAGMVCRLFFKCFGVVFNYPVVGISTVGEGRVFSRFKEGVINCRSPNSLCIEDPQNHGVFLGGNAYRCVELRERCESAFRVLSRKPIFNEQSILLRIVKTDYTARMSRRKEEMEAFYQRLVGIEFFALGDKDAKENEKLAHPTEVRISPFSRG